jgi:hypothetical protein
MNRYDDRFSRGRRSEYERDEWRGREGRESPRESRESFYPGNYGFEEGEYSGRTAGGPDEQPFSRNPYGYHPGENRSGDEWRDRGRGSQERYGSERFGQREPYNTRGDYSRSRPFRGEDERDYGRYGRSGSRYSESQYASGSREREPIGGYGPGGYGFGYEPGQREWPSRGGNRERGFGEGPFADTTERPGYFGMGYYGDGGAGPTGGFDQRTRQRNYGSLARDTFSSDRDWQSSNRWGGSSGSEQRRLRAGPKGYTRSDDRLKEDICERLMMADSVDSTEVTVNVKDGQVTLEGTVPNRRMKHSIEDLVDAAPGVQDIDNRIRVERGESRFGSSQSGMHTGAQAGTGSGMSSGAGSSAQRSSSTGTPGMSSSGTTAGASTAGGATQGTSGAGSTQTAPGSSASGQRRKE